MDIPFLLPRYLGIELVFSFASTSSIRSSSFFSFCTIVLHIILLNTVSILAFLYAMVAVVGMIVFVLLHVLLHMLFVRNMSVVMAFVEPC